MKLFLLKFFTWWSGQTFGTQLWTWRFGELVGQDEQGNRYYRTKGRKIDPTLGFERRWVVYNGYAEATRVPPSWHGWLHHTVDTLPTDENYKAREWQKPHLPNMTGTPDAYRPSGSTLSTGQVRPLTTIVLPKNSGFQIGFTSVVGRYGPPAGTSPKKSRLFGKNSEPSELNERS